MLALVLVLACTSHRLYYALDELPLVENDPNLPVAPGPWPVVPTVISNEAGVPDDLVLPTLRALMALPGATDACDAAGQPLPNAAEYCVATYKTPQGWRVTWPIRKLVEDHSSCKPPFGGVDDADFGHGLPVFGYAHNHPCGLFASSGDLRYSFPSMKSPEGIWVLVGYGTTPSGEPARDSQGQLIPAWGWLATGTSAEPRFYKWNPAGEVFKWNDGQRRWVYQATCKPQPPSMFIRKPLPPKCAPELVDWY
jgi:hypothetical protein